MTKITPAFDQARHWFIRAYRLKENAASPGLAEVKGDIGELGKENSMRSVMLDGLLLEMAEHGFQVPQINNSHQQAEGTQGSLEIAGVDYSNPIIYFKAECSKNLGTTQRNRCSNHHDDALSNLEQRGKTPVRD
ncbi:uncharacterized protein PAC_11310 [Phialocephala subalpina]|uniref:Uncharacterized protein n=1 Tax=Phialocephala subalpina TaxID=576137 RepID=A0A1L7X8R9_9HELO|nr:uncharacterized protein PAC_11310 [Phialocephala subalpina]